MWRKKKEKVEPVRWIPFAGADYMINYSQHFSNALNDLTPEEKLLLDLSETNKALMDKIKELEQKNSFSL
mgnify:CR=1 FL=1